MLQCLNEVSYKKNRKGWRQILRGRHEDLEGKTGGRGRVYSELAVCSKTREQTPQSHSANPSRQHWSLIISTPPSAVHTNTHIYTHFTPFLTAPPTPTPASPPPPPPAAAAAAAAAPLRRWKERGMKRTGGGGRRRKVRRDKGERKGRKEQLRFTPWAMRRHGQWVPRLPHLTTTITSNLLRLMASLTDHPRLVFSSPAHLREKKNGESSLCEKKVLTWKPNQPSLQFFNLN